MIELLGPKESNEYKAAVTLGEQFNELWPGIVDSPKEKEHIKIYASAKLCGYKVSDIDLIVVAKFARDKPFIPRFDTRDDKGNLVKNKRVYINNFVAVVEVKDHSAEYVNLEAGNIIVTYKGAKITKKSASDENTKQSHGLKDYFRDRIDEDIFIHKLVYLRNIPQNSNYFYLGMGCDAVDFFSVIASATALRFYNSDYHLKSTSADLKSTSAEKIKRVINAPIFREVLPTTLNRVNMDKILSENKITKEISSIMGEKFISLRGHGGSGKTIMYMQAIRQAYQYHNKRVLVLTYNTALAGDIKRLLCLLNIDSDDASRCVNVKTIHSHLYKIFYKFKINNSEDYDDDIENYNKMCEDFREKINIDIIKEIENDNDYNYDSIVIDEAQDFKNSEVDILKKIYGVGKICIADGIDQLMRGSRATWLTLEEKKAAHPINLTESLRMKRNLGLFVKEYAEKNNLPIDINQNQTAGGGNVIFLKNSYVENLSIHESLMANLKKNKNEKIDALFCSHNEYGFINFFDSLDQGYWNGFNKSIRKDFSRDNDNIRMLHYESIRGLEGWIVVLDEIDQYYEYLITNKNTKLSENEAKQRMLIALTRPIDTLVISVKDRNSKFSKMLEEICEKNKDFVEFY